MCHLNSAGLPPQCLVEVQVRDWLSIDTGVAQQPIMPGFHGSAPLGYRRAHPNPHCVATRLQFCSANLHLFLNNLAGSPHRRPVGVFGNGLKHFPEKLGSIVLGIAQFATLSQSPTALHQKVAHSYTPPRAYYYFCDGVQPIPTSVILQV